MQWDDRAIILSARRLGESAAIIHLITPEHGLYAGVDRGAFSKRKRGIYQQGNIVEAHWQARLSEQMGTISCELTDPIAAYILDDRRKLAALTSATMLTEKILSEREKQPAVYEGMETLVQALRIDADWLAAYVKLEFLLLERSGFGLDLERCAATGQSDDLHYVSPKSGRAVSREAGKPYHDRLFRLPAFLTSYSPLGGESQSAKRDAVGGINCELLTPHPNPPPQGGRESRGADITQILDGVRLCGYFLHERIFAPRGIAVPAVRNRFIQMLQVEEMSFGEATI